MDSATLQITLHNFTVDLGYMLAETCDKLTGPPSRDQLAMAAMKTLLAAPPYTPLRPKEVAEAAYRMADEMLAVRAAQEAE